MRTPGDVFSLLFGSQGSASGEAFDGGWSRRKSSVLSRSNSGAHD